MKAVVTGGAGFIGSHLVDRLLADGYEVTVVDDLSTGHDNRPGFEHPNCRLVSVGLPAEAAITAIVAAEPDVIFHLAAQASVPPSITDPLDDATRNVLGSIAVLEAARQVPGARVVYAASGGALYAPTGPFPAVETQAWHPVHPYGVSKAVVLQYLDFYRAHHGVHSAAVALANVYGPRQSFEAEGGVVAIFVNAAARGEAMSVHGSGQQTRDFVYVHDVVDAFVAAGTSEAEGLFNVGSGGETSILELAEAVLRIFPESSIDHAPARPMDVERSSLDATRARDVLGWRGTTSLSDGIHAVAVDLTGTSLPQEP